MVVTATPPWQKPARQTVAMYSRSSGCRPLMNERKSFSEIVFVVPLLTW